MSEPSKVVNGNIERITYRNTTQQVGKPQVESVVVRKNRTAQETSDQFGRILNHIKSDSPLYGFTERMDRLSDAYRRTARAMDATGRQSVWGGNPTASLISRKNNRRS